MRIAFDATVLHGRKSGIGYYCEELLRQMTAANHEMEFLVFSHLPLQLELPHANGNVRYAQGPHCAVRAFYMHALLPGILERAEPDLCHYTNFLAPVTQSRPYVVTIHDMGLEALKRCHPLAKRLYTRNLIPRTARGARLILTNSEFSKREIARGLEIDEHRIRVTPLAASPLFRPVSRVTTGPPYFLYVGNIEPRKNLDRLVQAYASLSSQLDHELWIVGNNWYRADNIRRLVSELRLDDRVKFLGYVSREELPGLYSGATAFVYPSLLEGFGMPVVEAMACGAPVITSNNSSLREIAEGAARLVDPSSVVALADAMRQLATDEAERTDLSRRGLQRAAQYSWEHTAALTLDAYNEALGTSPAATRKKIRPVAEIVASIRKTVRYAAQFDYPLQPAELHERLFDAAADRETFTEALGSSGLPLTDGFVATDRERIARRREREATTDRAVAASWVNLRSLISIPYVRMAAFSGATAHRNMDAEEDVDIFLVAEDGRLWLAFLLAMIWAKVRGLRRTLCVNYAVSDGALTLRDRDAFTAQQLTSLKPFHGKATYDRLLAANSFVLEHFPNFQRELHRNVYPDLKPHFWKTWGEAALNWGPAWILERLARLTLGWHFRRKLRRSSAVLDGHGVQLENHRLKLHFNDHRDSILKGL